MSPAENRQGPTVRSEFWVQKGLEIEIGQAQTAPYGELARPQQEKSKMSIILPENLEVDIVSWHQGRPLPLEAKGGVDEPRETEHYFHEV